MEKIAKWKRDNRFVEIVKHLPSIEDNAMYKVRVINSNDEVAVPEFMVDRTLPVVQLPETSEDADFSEASDLLSKEDLKRLWSNKIESFLDDELLHAYWRKQLQYRNKEDVKRLAEKEIIPKRLAKVRRVPLGAAFVFGKVHKRAWRTGKKHKNIKKEDEIRV